MMKMGFGGNSRYILEQKSLKQMGLIQFLCISLCLFCTSHVNAIEVTQPTLKADAPASYVVKKGDTLWDISARYLNSPWRWKEIWSSNPQIKNPHWIYPGDRLLLCQLNGQPIVGRDEGDGCNGIITRKQNTIRLKPQIRTESNQAAITALPLETLAPWFERSIILSPEQMAKLGYVVGNAEQRILAAKGQQIYSRGIALKAGQHYAIYREGAPYLTHKHGKKENLGIELVQVATGIAIDSNEQIGTIKLIKSYGNEVRQGDLVMLEPDPIALNSFYSFNADTLAPDAQVIRILGSINLAAKGSVVSINSGEQDGVKLGQVYAINQPSEQIIDIKTRDRVSLPSQSIGHLMVFRTFEHISYAYVLDSSVPFSVGAELVAP